MNQEVVVMNQEVVVMNQEVPCLQESFSAIPIEKEAFIAIFSLLEALSFEVMSGDVWWFANHRAKKLAVEKYGISEETYNQVMEKFDKARRAEGKKNPLSSMF